MSITIISLMPDTSVLARKYMKEIEIITSRRTIIGV